MHEQFCIQLRKVHADTFVCAAAKRRVAEGMALVFLAAFSTPIRVKFFGLIPPFAHTMVVHRRQVEDGVGGHGIAAEFTVAYGAAQEH